MLIKLIKDKQMIEQLLREEDNSLIINKLKIHEELKNFFIERSLSRARNELEELSKVENKSTIRSRTGTVRVSNRPDLLNTSKALINSSTISSINKIPPNRTLISNNSPSQSSHNISMMMNDSHGDLIGKKGINLDFNTEKYNIISNSPIHTPIVNKKAGKIKIDSINKHSRSIEYEDKVYNRNDHYLQTEFEETLSDRKNYIDKKNNNLLMSEKGNKKTAYISPIISKKTKSNLKSIANVSKEIGIKSNNLNDTSRDRLSVTSTGKKKIALTSFTSKLKK
jgi:hypothetical protein